MRIDKWIGCWVLCTVFLAPVVVSAQAKFTRINGLQDSSIPIPQYVPDKGIKDASALRVVADYLKAINIASWQGMQASGTFTDSLGNPDPATLTILGDNEFRLDVETPNGERSTRITGPSGETKEAAGKTDVLPPATASAGVFAFPRLFSAAYKSASVSLLDRGMIQVHGVPLHRVTMESPISPNGPPTDSASISVVDLYFDPSTHLLVKSASWEQVNSEDPARYLMVLTYGDYENVQGVLIPCRYQQTMNGQTQWTLQLNAPELHPSVDLSYFRF